MIDRRRVVTGPRPNNCMRTRSSSDLLIQACAAPLMPDVSPLIRKSGVVRDFEACSSPRQFMKGRKNEKTYPFRHVDPRSSSCLR